MKLRSTWAILLSIFCVVSCNKEEFEPVINPSVSMIEMEAEGGETQVSFTGTDWIIKEVLNKDKDSNVRISGNSYSLDGTLIRENYTLNLDRLGQVETLWSDKGFRIVRNTLSELKILMKENITGEAFSFAIVLQSGEELKEITVKQKKSEGYRFESIAYDIRENDGDSLYMSTKSSYRFFNVQEPMEFSISPYSGVNVLKRSFFISQEPDAFIWLEKEPVMVKTPSEIYNNEIYLYGEKKLYSNLVSESPYDNAKEELITIPVGNSEFFTKIQYRVRKVSYTLVLTNNRTREKKSIEGKWIETSPTGKYTIHWKNDTTEL